MKKMLIVLMALMLLGLSAASAEQMSFPEERQQTGTEVKALADLPKTTYTRQEIWLENEGQRIYGVAYIPDVEGKMPLAILSHGLGGSYSSCLAEAEQYASHGVAAYAFDFRGGGGTDLLFIVTSPRLSVCWLVQRKCTHERITRLLLMRALRLNFILS